MSQAAQGFTDPKQWQGKNLMLQAFAPGFGGSIGSPTWIKKHPQSAMLAAAVAATVLTAGAAAPALAGGAAAAEGGAAAAAGTGAGLSAVPRQLKVRARPVEGLRGRLRACWEPVVPMP